MGVFVSCNLFSSYTAQVVDKSVEGILTLLFVDKVSEFSFLLINCYLSPDGSPYANTSAFFNQLLSLLYLHSNCDSVIICGDINARIGSHVDYIEGIDNVKTHNVIDCMKNNYSKNLIEFLKDSKTCIVNGRITPDQNNFTCVNTNGKSVVDYFICQHENLKLIPKCEVLLIPDLLHNFNLFNMLSPFCKAPDHSLLSIEFTPFNMDQHLNINAKMSGYEIKSSNYQSPKNV